LRLNHLYTTSQLRLNIRNGKACVRVENFRVCILFEILNYPILPNAPPCFSNKTTRLSLSVGDSR